MHFKLGAPLTLPKSNKKSFVEGRKKSFIQICRKRNGPYTVRSSHCFFMKKLGWLRRLNSRTSAIFLVARHGKYLDCRGGLYSLVVSQLEPWLGAPLVQRSELVVGSSVILGGIWRCTPDVRTCSANSCPCSLLWSVVSKLFKL